MKAIETYYNGYRFRSRLEARWAVFFDTLGIRYEYEPEGFILSDGTRYLPDFYLLDSKSWFEVKGEMDEASAHKIDQFVREGSHMTIGYSNFEFNSMSYWGDEECFEFDGSDQSWLCECHHCGRKYFIGNIGNWTCPCCGAYDGDGHFKVLGEGDPAWHHNSKEFERAVNAAKRARFEHGENVAALKLYERKYPKL